MPPPPDPIAAMRADPGGVSGSLRTRTAETNHGDVDATFDEVWTTLGLAETMLPLSVFDTVGPMPHRAGIESPATGHPLQQYVDHNTVLARPLPLLSVGVAGDDPGQDVDFEVQQPLGEGGMGRVELTFQHSLSRSVAMKRVRPECRGPVAHAAILREARLLGSLDHPNIVPVHALGIDDTGDPILIMKRVDGVAWSDLLRDPNHPSAASLRGDPLTRNLEILIQCCNAVSYAHRRGVIHRDIKPDNVMVGDLGQVYLLDWGVAVRVEECEAGQLDALVGTPAYMAPEMLHKQARISERTDVYLLGAVLHEVLTGRPRHDASTLRAALESAYYSHPVEFGLEVPGGLAQICNQATHADPQRRYASAEAFQHAIVDYLRQRTSVGLSTEAAARLALVRQAVTGATLGIAKPNVRTLSIECRFGFQFALREYPDNTAAREGLRECLELMAMHELGLGNVAAAEEILSELTAPPQSLLAQLEARRARDIEENRRHARHARLAQNLDLGVSRRQRRTYMVAIIPLIATVLVAAVALSFSGHIPQTHIAAVGLIVSVTLMMTLGMAVGYRHFVATAANRRLIVTQFSPMVGMLANHIIVGILLGGTVAQVCAGDLLISGALAFLMGSYLHWRFFASAACYLLAAILTWQFPSMPLVWILGAFAGGAAFVYKPLAESVAGDTAA